MSQLKRIQRRRTAGWKAPLDSQGRKPLYVGRGSVWGNPFKLDPKSDYCKTPEGCVGAFGDWLAGYAFEEVEPERREQMLLRLRAGELKDKTLMCWCKEAESGEAPLCHADYLLKLSARMHPLPETITTITGPAPTLSPKLLKAST